MPSRIFYDGKMRSAYPATDPEKSHEVRNVLKMLHAITDTSGMFLPKPDQDHKRQMWFNVYSNWEKDQHTASRTNPKGCDGVMRVIKNLMANGVQQKSIGVISMYADDALRLRALLNAAGWSKVDCSTVDSNQGREKNIIVLHLVAARGVNAQDPRATPFGFVKEVRRLNFALTRAKEFMFLVGNFALWSSWWDMRRQDLNEAGGVKAVTSVRDYVKTNRQVVNLR